MNLAIYSRKSLFTGKGESIENQIQMCREYILSNIGIESQIFIYEDEGYSGGNTDRPKFQEMIKDIKAGKINRVVCYKLDRIGRSVAQLSNMFELLDKYNCSFTSITEQQFDTTTPMGRAMINIASTFAQLERETIAERVRDNMIGLAKTGRWLGGQSPLGFFPEKFTYIDEEFKERTLMKLTPIQDELELVKLIYELYFKFQSVRQVAKKLNLERVKGKNGGFLNTSILIRILKNPLYVKSDESSHKYLESTGMNVFGTPNGNGYITYNKTKKIIIDRHITEWIVAVSKHKGIIEASHWIKVQKLLENNKDKKVIRLGTGSKNTSILTGILKCEKCGGNMVIRHGHKEANTGKRFAYYICSNKDSRFVDKCTNPNIRVDKLDSIIISQIKAFKIHLLKESLEKVLLEASSQFKSDYYEKIQKEITEKNKAISNLVLTLSQCPNDDVTRVIMKQIASFNSEINELESSLETNHANNSKAQLKIKNLQFVIDSIEKFNSNINLIDDVNEKRLLIQTITKEILWNGDTYTAKVIINGLNHHY